MPSLYSLFEKVFFSQKALYAFPLRCLSFEMPINIPRTNGKAENLEQKNFS
eukprot:gene8542-5989_t